MNKIFLSLLLLVITAGCAPSSYIDSSGKLQVMVDPMASSTFSEIKSSADQLCSKYNKGSAKNIRKTGGNALTWYYYSFDCSGGKPVVAKSYSGNSSSSQSSSYSSSNNNNFTPRLYYDSSSGGMRECAHDPGVTGNCLSFKPYNPSLYDKNTLFYNPSTGAMQPCVGVVTVTGKCTSYGIFNYSKGTADKGQLFYNPKTNKMTTCSHVTVTGECAHYDLVQNSWAKNSGGFRMSSPDNPYYKKVPQSSQDLIDLGTRMLSGNCTLGLNC